MKKKNYQYLVASFLAPVPGSKKGHGFAQRRTGQDVTCRAYPQGLWNAAPESELHKIYRRHTVIDRPVRVEGIRGPIALDTPQRRDGEVYEVGGSALRRLEEK